MIIEILCVGRLVGWLVLAVNASSCVSLPSRLYFLCGLNNINFKKKEEE